MHFWKVLTLSADTAGGHTLRTVAEMNEVCSQLPGSGVCRREEHVSGYTLRVEAALFQAHGECWGSPGGQRTEGHREGPYQGGLPTAGDLQAASEVQARGRQARWVGHAGRGPALMDQGRIDWSPRLDHRQAGESEERGREDHQHWGQGKSGVSCKP